MCGDATRSGPLGPMGESFTPCDQDCPNCTESVFVLNMNSFRQEWRCPNNAAVTSYSADEFLAFTYQDIVRICPDLDVSPFILGLYENYNTVVYRIVDRQGCVRILQTEFAVKRNADGYRIAMIGTTQLLAIVGEGASRQLGTSVNQHLRRARI